MAALARLPKSKCSNLFSSMEHCLAARSFASSNRPIRLRKDHKGRMKGIACRGDHISFGSFALQAQDSSWITARQIEAGRRAMQRSAGKTAKIWVRLIADKSVTGKPIGTRMGSGKGAPQYTVAVVKPGRVLYEVGGVPENVAKKAVALAAAKMPIKTVFRTRSFCTGGAVEASEELRSYQQIEAVEKSDNSQSQQPKPDSPERALLSLPNLLRTLELGD